MLAHPVNMLGQGWRTSLEALVSRARTSLVLCSPFVSQDGIDIVAASISESFRKSGTVLILTNLSTLNVIKGVTDPASLLSMYGSVTHVAVRHLPGLHAKVYVSDEQQAVITSGNLTRSGIERNYEYGVEILDHSVVASVRADITGYADLGASVSLEQLKSHCRAAEEVGAAFRKQQKTVDRSLRIEYERRLRVADDDLIRLSLAAGSVQGIFARTILFLLEKHGPLKTTALEPLVQAIHPDLCDDSVERIIDGESFGAKWKHKVRSAQSGLKIQGRIERDAKLKVWRLVG